MADMPRRSNHEGTRPRKVKDRDLFRARVMIDGKSRDVYGKTPALTTAALRKLVADVAAGLKPGDPKYTVAGWLHDWQALYLTHLGRRTRQSYADTVRLYIEPAIGSIRLSRLHQDDVARMLAGAKGTRQPDLSPTTRRYIYTVLNIALVEAHRQGRVVRNVASLIDPPTKAPRIVRPLTRETLDILLPALVGHRHRAMLLVALAAGLREGELLGLTWPAIDLERGTLEVRGQLARETHLLIEPKRESRRSVDLPAETVAALRDHRATQLRGRVGRKDWDPRDFVFTTAEGQPYTAGVPRRALMSLLRRLALPASTTHALRHTFATLHIESGTDLAVVSKLLGHRDIGTTSNVYGHLTPKMRRDAADTMGRALRRKAT